MTSSTSSSAEGCVEKGKFHCLSKGRSDWMSSIERCTEAMPLLRKWTLNVTGSLEITFLMTFTESTHFPTFISLTQRKIHKPQSLKSVFLLPVIWGGVGWGTVLSFTLMPLCRKITLWCWNWIWFLCPRHWIKSQRQSSRGSRKE